MATACARWSNTFRTSRMRRLRGWRFPPASRSSMISRRTLRAYCSRANAIISRTAEGAGTMGGKVAIVMGSQSDWPTMSHAARLLEELDVAHETRIVSAHRTPDRMTAFAKGAEGEGFDVIIAGAGGAAHLPGMIAAMTHLPVLGVPVQSKALSGMDRS